MVKSKKGVSAIIGYVLLITFGIIMSVIVYNYLKTYVPKEALNCPDGVSIVLQNYDCNSNEINLTIKNNGKFNLAGFFIHGSNDADVEIATIDLSKNLSSSGEIYGGAILVDLGSENLMKPGAETGYTFDIDSNLESIELVPARFQEENNKIRFVSCGNAKITEKVICS